jgi:hypothetical protein
MRKCGCGNAYNEGEGEGKLTLGRVPLLEGGRGLGR